MEGYRRLQELALAGRCYDIIAIRFETEGSRNESIESWFLLI